MYSRQGSALRARDRAVAAWLWSGKTAVVAGSSAAAVLGAKWVDADAPAELISSRTRPPPLIVTRNETLLPGEQTVVAGIPVTTPTRTAFRPWPAAGKDIDRAPPNSNVWVGSSSESATTCCN